MAFKKTGRDAKEGHIEFVQPSRPKDASGTGSSTLVPPREDDKKKVMDPRSGGANQPKRP